MTSRSSRRWRPLLLAVLAASLILGGVIGYFATRSEPTPPASVLLERGLAAHEEGDLAEAARLYRLVLADDPDNVNALYDLGLVDQTEGRTADAEERYRAAIALDPEFVPALYNLAVLRGAAGDNEGAAALYRSVLAVDPEHAKAHLNLGFALIYLGQVAEGRDEIGRAAVLDPSLVDATQSTDATAGTTGGTDR